MIPCKWVHTVFWTFCSMMNQSYPRVSGPTGPAGHSLMTPSGQQRHSILFIIHQHLNAGQNSKNENENYDFSCSTWAIIVVTMDKGSSSWSFGSNTSLNSTLAFFWVLGLQSSSWQWEAFLNLLIIVQKENQCVSYSKILFQVRAVSILSVEKESTPWSPDLKIRQPEMNNNMWHVIGVIIKRVSSSKVLIIKCTWLNDYRNVTTSIKAEVLTIGA